MVMMKKYKAVIFDMDGTLLETAQGIIDGVNHTRAELGMTEVSDEEAKKHIGPTLQESFADVFVNQVEEAIRIYREYYEKKGQYSIELFDGMIDLLELLKLKGFKIAVSTMKYERFAKNIIDFLGIGEYFDAISGCDASGELSKAALIIKSAESMGLNKDEVMLIGDSKYDGIGANAAGVDLIAVTYGYGFDRENAVEYNPIFIADNVYEIIDWFKKNL